MPLQVAPPPEPPVPCAAGLFPLPPPADDIVEKVETAPAVFLAPPPPTAIGKDVAVTVILFPGVEYPSNGLAV